MSRLGVWGVIEEIEEYESATRKILGLVNWRDDLDEVLEKYEAGIHFLEELDEDLPSNDKPLRRIDPPGAGP